MLRRSVLGVGVLPLGGCVPSPALGPEPTESSAQTLPDSPCPRAGVGIEPDRGTPPPPDPLQVAVDDLRAEVAEADWADLVGEVGLTHDETGIALGMVVDEVRPGMPTSSSGYRVLYCPGGSFTDR